MGIHYTKGLLSGKIGVYFKERRGGCIFKLKNKHTSHIFYSLIQENLKHGQCIKFKKLKQCTMI